MPELAEVAYFVRQWRVGVGAKVERVETHPRARVFRESGAKEIATALRGKVLTTAAAAGKQSLFCFEEEIWLGIHLGMSGRLFVAAERDGMAPWAESPAGQPQPKHDHLVLHMGNGVALIYNDPRMFGAVRLHRGKEAPEWWRKIPGALTEKEFSEEKLRGILARHPRVLLKSLLLRQEYFPGVGNWMTDEILWRSGIAPQRRAEEVGAEEIAVLWRSIRQVCRDALRVIGESWYPVPDGWLFNHRWQRGGICPKDGAPLRYETVGGRTAAWCAQCQR